MIQISAIQSQIGNPVTLSVRARGNDHPLAMPATSPLRKGNLGFQVLSTSQERSSFQEEKIRPRRHKNAHAGRSESTCVSGFRCAGFVVLLSAINISAMIVAMLWQPMPLLPCGKRLCRPTNHHTRRPCLTNFFTPSLSPHRCSIIDETHIRVLFD